MPEPFRSLASMLSAREARVAQPISPAHATLVTDGEAEAPCVPHVPLSAASADGPIVDLLDGFVSELARLRARAAERFEEQAEAVLADLAGHVLARELATEPAAIEALLAEAVGEIGADSGVVVYVASRDAERLRDRWPVAADERLRPGDFAVEIGDGRYEASLQTRFEAMLASHRVTL